MRLSQSGDTRRSRSFELCRGSTHAAQVNVVTLLDDTCCKRFPCYQFSLDVKTYTPLLPSRRALAASDILIRAMKGL